MLREYYLNVNTYQKAGNGVNEEELSDCNVINYTVHKKIILKNPCSSEKIYFQINSSVLRNYYQMPLWITRLH